MFKNYFEFNVQRGAKGKRVFTPPVDGADGRWAFGPKKFLAYKVCDSFSYTL